MTFDTFEEHDKSVAVMLLHQQGLRPSAIAARLGIPRSTIYGWFNGSRTPTVALAPFRVRFEQMEADDAASVIALRLGWFNRGHADADRVRRTLGLRPTPNGTKNGKHYPPAHRQRIQRRTALQLCEAMGMDPTDVGL